ncbi:MAG: hypothetical protein ACFFG0_37005, partial [Candidatus Thorarchaeota archaeon]
VDFNNGRRKLYDETKSSSLLNIYLYNYKEDRWDKGAFVSYDDYTGTNTFSYIVDRGFLMFENYFNDTGTGEFELKVIFIIEGADQECFLSKAGFSISSIAANMYYSSPKMEKKVIPRVEFDVDITEYYTDYNIYLEEIRFKLDYYGELEFDDSFVFSQYAFLEENYKIYIRNEYLDFEEFSLEDDEITLSREEIDRFIYHDIENDKYIIRVKLEYDWNCILQLNIGTKSKLDITSTLNLNKYDLSVSYSLYETTRISATENKIPFQLTAVYGPNYIQDGNDIFTLNNDEILDIGLFGSFLRSTDTRQRLMLREQLYYSFTQNSDGVKNILLDQEYTDTILRFLVPYGYLKSPSDYITNNTYLTFISDSDVESVEFYYHDGNNYQKKGDMTLDETDKSKFIFTWTNAIGDTGVSSSEVVKIMFNITDILGNNGQYEYPLIADFDAPAPEIILENGIENYQDEQVAAPDTLINFNSNELEASSESQPYTWEDTFSSFDSQYMSYSYSPDDYSSIWNMGPLYMQSSFPTKSISETWNNWNLNYNIQDTTSSFINGDLASYLNSQLLITTQPADFELTNGEFSQYGDLESIDGNYSIIKAAAYTGDYPGTYSFTDEADGTSGTAIDYVDAQYISSNCEVKIYGEYENHKKILRVKDGHSAGNGEAKHYFDSTQTSGTVEWWWLTPLSNSRMWYHFHEGTLGTIGFSLKAGDGVFSPDGGIVSQAYNVNQWYHHKIIFNTSSDTFDWYIDGVLVADDYAFTTAITNVGSTNIKGAWSTTGDSYFDAIGYSWDPNYDVGDNTDFGWTSALKPDGDVETQWTAGAGTPHYLAVDEDPDNPDSNNVICTHMQGTGKYERYNFESVELPVGATITSVKARVKFFQSTAGTPQINLYFDGTYQGWKNLFKGGGVQNYTWTGLSGDQSDLNALQIRFVSDFSGIPPWEAYLYAVWVYVYYEIPQGYPLDIQVDLDINDPSCIFIDKLLYSHRTNVSQTVDLDIWNWDTQTWYQIESVNNYASFADDSYTLGSSSPYISSSAEVRIRFQAFGSSDLQLEIDRLALKFYSHGDNYADITKTINDSFLNRYDSGFSSYTKIYNITTTFDYRFTKYHISLDNFAQFTIDGNDFALIKDGSWHTFAETIEFDSTSKNSFDLMFNISNGLLELDNMGYTYEFMCLDTSDHIMLQQNFEIEFPKEEELVELRNIFSKNFIIYTSYSFFPTLDGKTYYNTYGRTNKLEIILKIKIDGIWYENLIYTLNSAETGVYSFNITQFMKDNGLTSFQDFAVEYVLIGNSSELTVDYVSLNCTTRLKYIQEYYRIIDNVMGNVSKW